MKQNDLYILRYGIFAKIWPYLSLFLVKIGGPKLAAYLSYKSIDWGELDGDKTIVCLYRESFIKDIDELRKHGKFNYIVIMGGFTRFQMLWTSPDEQVQTFYQKVIQKNARYDKKRDMYVSHLMRLIGGKVKINAILSANFDYWQDVPFKQYAKGKEIPFFVLSREHPIVPKVCDYVINRYSDANFKFDSSAMAVAGESTKNVMIKSGIVNDSRKIIITGLPRYDAWKDISVDVKMKDRVYITLLSFTKGYYADNTFIDVLQVFLELSCTHTLSNVQFLLKTKDANDSESVKNIIEKHKFNKKNVDISHDLKLFDVLPLSKVVIGYNSLSLVEAAMARTPIVLPVWNECKSEGGMVMYPKTDTQVLKVVHFANTQEQLIKIVEGAIHNNLELLESNDAENMIKKYIYLPTHEHGSTFEVEKMFRCFGI